MNLEVGGKSVAIDEKVRARVGLALGQAVQAQTLSAGEAGESLVRKAQTWGWMRRICGVAICAGTSCRMCRARRFRSAADCSRPQVAERRMRGHGRTSGGRRRRRSRTVRAADCGGGGVGCVGERSTRRRARRGRKVGQLSSSTITGSQVVAGDVCADDLPGEGEDEDWTATTVVMERAEAWRRSARWCL